MTPLLYADLVSWYRLLDPVADHADEAACYLTTLEAAAPRARTLLELGAGAGNNALYLRQRFDCTLTDLSEAMLGLSRELNPECEHLLGDMRGVRLGRRFDAVFVHDAISYMSNGADLDAALTTAFEHTAPGGVALFAPDAVRESFAEGTELHEADDQTRSLRCLQWQWDPDVNDESCQVDYAFLLRDGGSVRAVHDQHVEGLFSRQHWLSALERAGFRAELTPRPLDDGGLDQIFLGRRPLK